MVAGKRDEGHQRSRPSTHTSKHSNNTPHTGRIHGGDDQRSRGGAVGAQPHTQDSHQPQPESPLTLAPQHADHLPGPALTAPQRRAPHAVMSGSLVQYERFDDDFFGMTGSPVTDGPPIETDLAGKVIVKKEKNIAAVGASSMLVKALAGGIRHGIGGSIKVEGSPFIWQLLINHLKHMGGRGSAAIAALKQEMIERDISPTFYSPEASPLDLGDKLSLLGSGAGSRGGAGGVGVGGIAAGGGDGGYASLHLRQLSPLSRIVFPHTQTRAAIYTLLSNVNLRHHSICNVDNDADMASLMHMAQQDMWTESKEAFAHTLCYHPTSGKLRAASLNQIVEAMTPVFLTPHQSQSKEAEADRERFCVDVFLTHRLYTTSAVLLAKLLQRFAVPLHLPFSETFNQHNIVVDIKSAKDIPGVSLALDFPTHLAPLVRGRNVNDGGDFASLLSSSSSIWMSVSRLMNIRVATIIALWAREFPEQFDMPMCEAVEAWIDECCCGGVGCVWSNSPSQLYCCAEAILHSLSHRIEELAFYKSHMASSDRAAGKFNAGASGPVGFALHSPYSAVAPTLRPTSLVNASRVNVVTSDELPIRLPVVVARPQRSGGGSGDGPSIRQSGAGGIGSAATSRFRPRSHVSHNNSASQADVTIQIQEFLGINTHVASAQLTSIDRILIRRVTSEELFVLSISDVPGLRDRTNSAASSTPSALCQMLARFESLMSWVLDRLIDAIQQDIQRQDSASQMWPITFEVLQHAVTLAFRLLQSNNFHSGFAVVSALLHPGFSTVYRHVLLGTVPKSLKVSIEELAQLFDFSQGAGKFRTYVDGLKDTSARPVIPLIQLMAEEIRQMETTQATVLIDAKLLPTLHWRKMRVIATILRKLRTARVSLAASEAKLDEEVYEWLEVRLGGPFRSQEEISRVAAEVIKFRIS